jgi:putative spermidine/putrescine transport system ATP-binding protein
VTDSGPVAPATRTASAAVQLVALHKSFGDIVAVDGVDLTVGDGEFFSMLGPSGSGKTTVLRMIAGFERPSAGAILLQGRDVTSLAPYERDVNTVFQDYALFPHMTVQQNVEYGLKVKKVARADRRRRAGEALETVRLSAYAPRKPSQLSGGQRQRVALARALVNRPKVLLLDEPLGALDLKLREEMQVELKAIQHRVGITFVFVTHDQHEALSMSERIAVFNHGRIEQVGTPREIYEHPTTTFVAGFVGTTNVIAGAVAQRLLGRPGTFTVRPERVDLLPDGADVAVGMVHTDGTVRDVQYLGAECRCRVRADAGIELVASVAPSRLAGLAPGTRVRAAWPASAAFEVADSGAAFDGAPDAVATGTSTAGPSTAGPTTAGPTTAGPTTTGTSTITNQGEIT